MLDHFQDPEDGTTSYIVMPFLRPLADPYFDLVDNVVDFVDQILEVCAEYIIVLILLESHVVN